MSEQNRNDMLAVGNEINRLFAIANDGISKKAYIAAKKENRFSLPNTRYLVHQPSGGSRGNATDIKIQMEEILKTKERINRIISEETGRPLEQVEKDTDRDYWMSVDEAIDYGIVTKVVHSISELD